MIINTRFKVILFRFKYEEFYGTCRLKLSLFKSSSKRQRKVLISVFCAKASEKRRTLRKSFVPDALLNIKK